MTLHGFMLTERGSARADVELVAETDPRVRTAWRNAPVLLAEDAESLHAMNRLPILTDSRWRILLARHRETKRSAMLIEGRDGVRFQVEFPSASFRGIPRVLDVQGDDLTANMLLADLIAWDQLLERAMECNRSRNDPRRSAHRAVEQDDPFDSDMDELRRPSAHMLCDSACRFGDAEFGFEEDEPHRG